MLHVRSDYRRATERWSRGSRRISPSGRSARPPNSPTPSARTPASGSCVTEHFVEKCPEIGPHPARHVLAESVRGFLFHVDGFGELELHGVHLVRRLAVSAGDVAAFEAAVQDYGIVFGNLDQALAQTGTAG